MNEFIQRMMRRFGYQVIRCRVPAEVGAGDRETLTRAQRFTMTSMERLRTLVDAVHYVARNRIPGDIVECGVWRGGSMMAVALTLIAEGDTERDLYLYDTFEGMPEPTANDRRLCDGARATDLLRAEKGKSGIWCAATLEDVRANMLSTGYPAERLHFVRGKVEDTIPATLPNAVALLRLDTDWYASTRHELSHLYPLLSARGVLILDDYGYWQGAKKATDEYFASLALHPFLHRIDEDGRIHIKTDAVGSEQRACSSMSDHERFAALPAVA